MLNSSLSCIVFPEIVYEIENNAGAIGGSSYIIQNDGLYMILYNYQANGSDSMGNLVTINGSVVMDFQHSNYYVNVGFRYFNLKINDVVSFKQQAVADSIKSFAQIIRIAK